MAGPSGRPPRAVDAVSRLLWLPAPLPFVLPSRGIQAMHPHRVTCRPSSAHCVPATSQGPALLPSQCPLSKPLGHPAVPQAAPCAAVARLSSQESAWV